MLEYLLCRQVEAVPLCSTGKLDCRDGVAADFELPLVSLIFISGLMSLRLTKSASLLIFSSSRSRIELHSFFIRASILSGRCKSTQQRLLLLQYFPRRVQTRQLRKHVSSTWWYSFVHIASRRAFALTYCQPIFLHKPTHPTLAWLAGRVSEDDNWLAHLDRATRVVALYDCGHDLRRGSLMSTDNTSSITRLGGV